MEGTEPLCVRITEHYVHISQRPGLGMDIDWDFIERHKV